MTSIFFAEIMNENRVCTRTIPLTDSANNAKQLIVKACHEGLIDVQLARTGMYYIYEMNFIDSDRIFTCGMQDLTDANIPKNVKEGMIIDLL